MRFLKYYVTADIHGFYKPLIEALTETGYFEDKEPHKLIILGDLFDRGKEAKELQTFVADLLNKDEIILIKGNHEDLYEELVTVDEGLPYEHHVHNGTYDTALQLSSFDRGLCRIRHYDFAEAARNTPYYQKIIPAMKDYFETDNYVFVHGWIPCIAERAGYSAITDWRNSTAREWREARWYNGMDAAQTAEEEKTVVCGHWHTSYGHSKYESKGTEFGPDADFSPYYGPGIIALDACTGYSGKVNCIVIED